MLERLGAALVEPHPREQIVVDGALDICAHPLGPAGVVEDREGGAEGLPRTIAVDVGADRQDRTGLSTMDPRVHAICDAKLLAEPPVQLPADRRRPEGEERRGIAAGGRGDPTQEDRRLLQPASRDHVDRRPRAWLRLGWLRERLCGVGPVAEGSLDRRGDPRRIGVAYDDKRGRLGADKSSMSCAETLGRPSVDLLGCRVLAGAA